MVANTLLFAFLVVIVSGIGDVMKNLCESPVNPACVGIYTAPVDDVESPQCQLKCAVKLPEIESRPFCPEQLPYSIKEIKWTPDYISCVFHSVVSCEDGKYFVGKCVIYHPQRMTYVEAEAECNKENGMLETFEVNRHKNWIAMSTSVSEPAIWVKSSSDGNVLLLANNDLGKAGTVIKSEEPFRKMTFYCSVAKKEYTMSHKLYCEALKKLNVAASFENGKCMVLTNSLYFGAQANTGTELHETCMNISPFEGRAAVPFRQMESEHMKHVVAGSHVHTIIQPATTLNVNDDPYYDWCSKIKEGLKMYSFTTHNNGSRGTVFEIPEYTFNQSQLPDCIKGEGIFKIASVGRTKDGNVPMSKAFAIPTACLIAPNLNNAVVGTCDPGWIALEKYQGFVWCVKFIEHPPKSFNNSEILCKTQHAAIITGFDNELEYEKLLEQATIAISQNAKEGSVWLGAVRKPQCVNADRDSPSPCHYQEQFEWIDGVTIGGFAFTHWWEETGGVKAPDNEGWSEQTLSMVINPGTWMHGLMNDLEYDNSATTTGFWAIQGSFCGKRANMS